MLSFTAKWKKFKRIVCNKACTNNKDKVDVKQQIFQQIITINQQMLIKEMRFLRLRWKGRGGKKALNSDFEKNIIPDEKNLQSAKSTKFINFVN